MGAGARTHKPQQQVRLRSLHWRSSAGHTLLVRSLVWQQLYGDYQVIAFSLAFNQRYQPDDHLEFQKQTDHAYFGEELIEEISKGIIQVNLNVMAQFRLMPTTSKLEGFHMLRLFCPDMGLCKFDSTRSREIV
ncbi:hypothetical protein FF1_035369 [Malus domestica]